MSNVDISNKSKAVSPKWDLDSIFAGGSSSPEFRKFCDAVRADLAKLAESVKTLPVQLNDSSRAQWIGAILEFQRIGAHLEMARSFAHCLATQNVKDDNAQTLEAEIDTHIASWLNLRTGFESSFAAQSDGEWEKLTADAKVVEIKFPLDEMRRMAKHKMSPELEALAQELAVNGYHGWARLYDKVSGEISVEFAEKDTVETMSIGQLSNKFQNPDRDIRRRAFETFEKTWAKETGVCSSALNSQAGFRLALYRNRGWKNALVEPLMLNRSQQETLDAMWSAVKSVIPDLKRYTDAKKKLMGTDKFCWYDQFAPVGHLDLEFTFDQAVEFIVRHLGSFSEEMATFSRMAIDKRWVEAEDRAGKADGAYCTGLNLRGESRVFMTYSDDYSSMSTLAHELGHAYHQWVLKDTPQLATEYPMGLAETASIFNELRVGSAALQEVSDKQGKLMLLDQDLQGTLILFCNIYARYLFDKRFYEERADGIVGVSRLDEMMLAAQKEAFGDILDPKEGYHPRFWASKLHFYITDSPFYNFPYTMGFLFAGGVYERAEQEGKSFAKKYRSMLEDTGKMTTEQVAKKHLNVDLTKDEFWRSAVLRATARIDEFVNLVNS
ncbi:MAG: M3 family oligoendopeptidase [bacterium]|nr:M3 family oligoendopeptidase [bacterium]